ncbi:MAG: hypothetical protein J5953_02010 [Prevotella sp.]|nr:hypothetical protein [Prevotella sp.]
MSDRFLNIIVALCLIGASIMGSLAWCCYQKMQAYDEQIEIVAADSIL